MKDVSVFNQSTPSANIYQSRTTAIDTHSPSPTPTGHMSETVSANSEVLIARKIDRAWGYCTPTD